MTAEATAMHRWVFPVPVPPIEDRIALGVQEGAGGVFDAPRLVPREDSFFQFADDRIGHALINVLSHALLLGLRFAHANRLATRQ